MSLRREVFSPSQILGKMLPKKAVGSQFSMSFAAIGKSGQMKASVLPSFGLVVWFCCACLRGVVCDALPVPTNQSIYKYRRLWKWCGLGHEVDPLIGLDDRLCQKIFPPKFDREFTCPTVFDFENSTFSLPATNVSHIDIDETELKSVLAPGISAAIGIIRRHDGKSDPPYTIRYVGHNARAPLETWSSSKVFAGSRAGQKLRSVSEDDATLQSTEYAPPHTAFSLDDLMTIVTSYDTTHGLSSNEIGKYYHSIGGYKAANDFIHDVLGASSEESFGGGYGEAIPPSLGYNFSTSEEGASGFVTVTPDGTPSPPISNTMSPITMADFLRRIIFAREDGDGLFEWGDSKSILYGAEKSQLFDDVPIQFGGMSMSSDVYVQLGQKNMSRTNEASEGLWRIFSKLGFGFSSIRKRFEVVLNGYGCFPIMDGGSKGKGPARNRGLEFVLSVRAHDYNASDDGRGVDLKVREAMRNITSYLEENYG